MRYEKEYTRSVSFPLGGIGSGNIGIAGNGALVDWEINNKPNRESVNPFSFFAIKAVQNGRLADCRILQGDIADGFMGGKTTGNHSWGYGHGANRSAMTGLKHFTDVVFEGDFPFATVTYRDKSFPADIKLTAFNPFIPSNVKDSCIPAIYFDFEITNRGDSDIEYTLAAVISNPLLTGASHRYYEKDGLRGIIIESIDRNRSHCNYGEFAVTTKTVGEYQEYWYRGEWFDDITMFVNDFFTEKPLKNRHYTPSQKGRDVSTLTANINIKKGESQTVRFVYSWYVPNFRKYWERVRPIKPVLHNYYARLFGGAADVAAYCHNHSERLLRDTRLFGDALKSSALPPIVYDAIQGNLATLNTTTCLMLEDGYFWAWEGVSKDSGSCEGSCQHVWNYEYALPSLFPTLAKGMRSNELDYSMEKSGLVHFRLTAPLHHHRQYFPHACVDGQMGGVAKCYREWKTSGDTEWLKKYWSKIKLSIEYAWSDKNKDKWDPSKSGLITGRQHHTLDVELFGANSWLTGFYHLALLAGAEMAKAVGDNDTANKYLKIFERGREALKKTFNGRHFVQDIDLCNKDILSPFKNAGKYWDNENRELKYQLADGCEIDQVIADWHADLIGLPHVFDQEQRLSALKEIYRLNYRSMRDYNNPCRIFACNDEKGAVMCIWDKDAKKPAIPIPYTEECMTGFEYATADNMLQCGMEKEAIDLVSAVRDRYDGKKRNPWAEIECGANYARAMASYSLLLTYSGIKIDNVDSTFAFSPIRQGKYFFSTDGGWGVADYGKNDVVISVLYGKLNTKMFILSEKNEILTAKLNDKTAENAIIKRNTVTINTSLNTGDSLSIQIK